MAAAVSAGVHPVVLGGDNSITWATVAGLLDAVDGRVGIVDLDAHLDVRVAQPVVNSGTPFRRILTDFTDRVAAANVAQIGHRQFANSRPYRQWAAKQGVRVFDMETVDAQGMDAVLEQAVAAATDGTDHLVLTVDMDALDQTYAPGVSAPTPSGLLPPDLFATVRRLGRHADTRFAEFVEVAPPLDPVGNTARLTAVAALEYVAARTRTTATKPS
jgi:formimidoylglutamase